MQIIRNVGSKLLSRTAALRLHIAFLLLVTAFSITAAAECSPLAHIRGKALSYTFEPLLSPTRLTLHVILEFQGNRSGAAKIELPSEWAGQSGLEDEIRNLKPLSADTTISNGDPASTKIVHFPRKGAVRLAFDLVQDWSGAFRHPMQFRAVLEPDFFEFTTQNALVHPIFHPNDHVTVHLEWKDFPPNWHLLTSFGTDNPCRSFAGHWSQFADALFAGGEFRVQDSKIPGGTLVFAVRGEWPFTDAEALTNIERVIAAERGFWRDTAFPYYLVTLVPFASSNSGDDGSAFTNAFWLFLAANSSFSYPAQYTLAHEGFHTWNPLKMGPRGQDASQINWFREGFTDYYSGVLLLRSGFFSFPDYIQHLNDRIREYEAAELETESIPGRATVPRSTSLDELPYIRGAIYALWLDGEIRKESHNKSSLDDFMRKLVQESRKHPRLRLTGSRIFRDARRYLTRQSVLTFQAIATNNKSIAMPAASLGPCVRLTQDQIQLFDLGFDRATFVSKHEVAGVVPDSAAFKAGIRDGQRLTGWSIYWNNVTKPVRLVVISGTEKRTIQYLPLGKTVSIPQYHVNQALWRSHPETCSLFAN